MHKAAEKEGTKSKNIHAKLRKNGIFGKSIENPMHKAYIKMWPQENNSDQPLDQPLKEKDNFLMEEQLAKKKTFRFK